MRVLIPTLTAILGFSIGLWLIPDQPTQTSTVSSPTRLVEAVFTREDELAVDDHSIPVACLEQIDTARRAQDWETFLHELTSDAQLHETGILAQALVLIAQSRGCRRSLASSIQTVLADHGLAKLNQRYVEDPRTIGRLIKDKVGFMTAACHVIPDPWLGSLPTGTVSSWLADMDGDIAIAKRPGEDRDTWFERVDGTWRASVEPSTAVEGRTCRRHKATMFFDLLASCELLFEATDRDAYRIRSLIESQWIEIRNQVKEHRASFGPGMTAVEQQRRIADYVSEALLPMESDRRIKLVWAMPWPIPRSHTLAKARHTARTEVDAIAEAVDRFVADEQRQPRLADLFNTKLSVSAYMLPNVSRLDPWWRPYVIDCKLSRGELTVRSAGPDMRLKTPDDILRRVDNRLMESNQVKHFNKQGWPVFQAQVSTDPSEKAAVESSASKAMMKSRKPR